MNLRFRLLVILAGAIAVIATFTFPIWQPLLERNVVEEAFPGLAPELQTAFEELPQEQKTAFAEMRATDTSMALAMVNAALAEVTELPEADQAMPEMQGAEDVTSGSFTRIDSVHWAEGTATIYQLPDNSKILRLEDFRSANGPDLRVILSAAEAPMTDEEMRQGNLDLELGLLKGTIGNQNYQIPSQIDLSQYNSVVIYCRSFGIVFSSAPI
ncbi:MAG: DM13 domain-containing protein [Anaerolineae bacterium]|nr:DM13 domain-containing protein [Anaerolineae bacterium]